MEEEWENDIITGITPDLAWIRRHDEVFKKDIRDIRIISLATLVCLLLAVSAFRFSSVLAVILGLLAAAGLIILILWRRNVSSTGLKNAYEDAMMAQGMVVKTEPLTVAVIADIRNTDQVPECYGCYFQEVKKLPGTKGELYEKVPCACRFYDVSGNYWNYFQPRPLCWGTPDRMEIEEVCRCLEQEQRKDGTDLWEVLKNLAGQFPDMEKESMIKLDENFCPAGYKRYYETEYTPLLNEAVQKKYHKRVQQAEQLQGSLSAMKAFNRLADLAVKHGTYDYLNSPCSCGDYGVYSKTGFYTYFGDGTEFLESERKRSCPFAEGEVPLIGGEILFTTRGCWRKKEFLPWEAVSVDTKINADGKIEVRINGKLSVAVPCHVKEYEGYGQFEKSDIIVIQELERKRIQEFLDAVKQEFMKWI